LKKGFGLATALLILILVAVLLNVVVKISFISVKHTSDSYLRERAELFMQSSIENALLAIEGYERNSSCLKEINFTDEDRRFFANIKILRYYCYDLNDCPCGSLAKKIDTDFSNGYVLLDVLVESNLSNKKNNNKLIRLEKITLQRP